MLEMIWRGHVTTDANGLFMYDPTVFRAAYGASLRDGRNLLQEYLSDDCGDEALRSGLVVPILAIDADTYSVSVSTEPAVLENIVCTNAVYALRVEEGVVVADIAQLMEWSDAHAREGFAAPVPCGIYAVSVAGFQRRVAGEIIDAGYVFTLEKQPRLPAVTADTGHPMRVLDVFE
ncbi:MAG: hypothetical protein RLO52_37450 [Sandaracinaceae bacterium]|nr:MAG: hypothetical protein EVA89_01780 [Sandaracinaceae bacterium]